MRYILKRIYLFFKYLPPPMDLKTDRDWYKWRNKQKDWIHRKDKP